MAATKVYTLALGIVRAYLLVGTEGAVLVDSGYGPEPLGTALEAALAAAGNSPLKAILVTHAHTDHSGGLGGVLRDHPGLPVLAGAGDAEALAAGVNAMGPGVVPFGLKGRLLTRFSGALARPLQGHRPEILLGEGATLSTYGVEAEVLATPGHTPGSLSLVLPEAVDGHGRSLGRAAIVGDLVMGGFLLHALPSPPLYATGWEELRASVGKLQTRGIDTYLPGHGGPLAAATVYRRYGMGR